LVPKVYEKELSSMMRNAFGQILITHQKKKWNQFTKDID
jgi:hypothetical protein